MHSERVLERFSGMMFLGSVWFHPRGSVVERWAAEIQKWHQHLYRSTWGRGSTWVFNHEQKQRRLITWVYVLTQTVGAEPNRTTTVPSRWLWTQQRWLQLPLKVVWPGNELDRHRMVFIVPCSDWSLCAVVFGQIVCCSRVHHAPANNKLEVKPKERRPLDVLVRPEQH